MKSVLITLLSGLLAFTAQAAPFAVPAESIPPFRRAMLPIDTDSMSGLSSHLTILAQGSPLESAPQRRATAQSLALALALDPENSSARSVLTEIAGGNSPIAPDGEKINRAKTCIWEMFGWLASPEAGGDGNLLADLLGDAASVLDSAHPTAVSLHDSPERGKWEGWVAPLTSFTEKEPEKAPPLAEVVPEAPEKKPDPSPPKPGFKASSASIGAVLSVYDKASENYILKHTTVSMEAGPFGEEDEEAEEEEEEERSGLLIDIPCAGSSEHKVGENVANPILNALGKIHGSRLPEGRVGILTGAARTYSYKRNGTDLTGPGLILANAAVTGISPDATIIATLDGKGGIALPGYFWRKLGALADGPGGRLIVPAAAEEYFMGILALEKPEFFFNYEVLIANSPAEAIALCAKEPDEAHAAVFAKFREIKEKAEGGQIGSYVANRFVRQRLAEVTDAAPFHLSAKLLAIQGAGERPRILARNILAAEVFEAIDPIHGHAELDVYSVSAERAAAMEKTHDAARGKLDGLDRYADIRDRDLVSKGKAVASALRSYCRVVSGRSLMWDKYVEAQRALATADRELRAELSRLTGDELPERAEARERALERSRLRGR